MRKLKAAFWICVILFIAYGVGKILLLIGAVFGLVVLARIIAITHPRTLCSTCKGVGRFYAPVFSWMFRLCANCGGNGRVIHVLGRHWGIRRVRLIAEGELRDRRERRPQRGFGRLPLYR